jgi:hypothetical protein
MSDIENPAGSTPAETAAEITAIALNAVPVVGGVLAGIANSVIARRQNQRLNKFLADLAEDLKAAGKKINKEFVRSSEFEDFVEDIFSKAAEARQQEKLDALRAIFLNTVLSDRPKYDEATEIAELIHRWQPRHVILLKILDNPRVADEQMGRVVGNGGGISTSINRILRRLLPEWDDDQIDRTWQELYNARIHRTPGTKTMMSDTGIGQLENRLDDFGRKVADYLRNPVHHN